MRFSSIVSTASVVAFAGLVAAEPPVEGSDVKTLTGATFDAEVKPAPLVLVEFYAPWCGHCKALAPHYEEAATALKGKNIHLAKVDCVEEADLCQAHGVQGYPTLKVFRNGEAVDYTGPRKTDGIVSYMIKQSLPAVSEVAGATHDEFKQADKIVVIAYVASNTALPSPEFSAAAEKHRDDYLFGIVTDEDAIAAAGVTAPAIVVYRQFDEPRTDYPYPVSGATVKDIEEWVKDLSVPILDEVSGENYATYAASEKPLAYLFIDPTADDKEAQIALIKPVALQYKDKVNFVWIDAIKFGDHAKALNLPEVKWPAFVIQDMVNQHKYPFDQATAISTDSVKSMIEKYVDGKLQPNLKSQSIPESQDGSVIVLVTKQFDQIALDESKDVFIEFYAPWCGHCKRLAPIWDTLAERYASVKENISIVKMDATENDIPPSVDFRVSGFPTLKFKPAGGKTFIDYDGDRSIESLIEFVEANAKNSLDVPAYVAPPVEEVVDEHAGHNHAAEEHDEL